MRRKFQFAIVALVSLLLLYSCTKDVTKTPVVINCSGLAAPQYTYAYVSQNILNIYCAFAPCHGGGSSNGGVSLDTYSGAVNAFKNQNALCAIKNAGCILMPNGGPPLDSLSILELECWQQNGYQQ